MTLRLFVTGGSGFVGRHFVPAAALHGASEIMCLSRAPGRAAPAAHVTHVTGDLSAPESYADRLASADAVVHLAARTGRASADQHRRTNLRGTLDLLEQCRKRGVARFLNVSTIAVKFRETGDYPYATSKLEAESAVRESGLTYSILRPTLIVGRGGGAWEGLHALGRRPVIPLPGPGTARVQPIDVADVVRGLLAVLDSDRFWNGTFDLGGPEPLSIEAFLQRIHWRYRGREARIVHLPVRPLLPLLRRLERWAPALAPVGPGQVLSFLEDGLADPNPLFDHVRQGMTPVDAMIRRATDGD